MLFQQPTSGITIALLPGPLCHAHIGQVQGPARVCQTRFGIRGVRLRAFKIAEQAHSVNN